MLDMEKLSDTQNEVLNGLLLGDGCLYKLKSNRTPLLSVGRAAKDLAYLEHQHSIFRTLCSDKGIFRADKFDKTNGKTYEGFKFRTRNLEVLQPHYELWYPNGQKVVPKTLELTPLTLAHWFCDDGCISVKDNKGKKSNALRLKISTNSFTQVDVEFLRDLISDVLQAKFSVHKDSMDWYADTHEFYSASDNGFFLLAYTETAWKLFDKISQVFPPGMERKLNVWGDVVRPSTFTPSRDFVEHRHAKLLAFINAREAFYVSDVAKELNWYMDTSKYGIVPSASIRACLSKLVDAGVLIKSPTNEHKRGFQYARKCAQNERMDQSGCTD